MKGEETENKKVGCTVNLMVRGHELFLLTGTARVSLAWVWKLPSKQDRLLTSYMYFILLQNFYKSEINKEEMYIRYIHKLCDMHLQAENYTGEWVGKARAGSFHLFINTENNSRVTLLRAQQCWSSKVSLPLSPLVMEKQVKLLSLPTCAPWPSSAVCGSSTHLHSCPCRRDSRVTSKLCCTRFRKLA